MKRISTLLTIALFACTFNTQAQQLNGIKLIKPLTKTPVNTVQVQQPNTPSAPKPVSTIKSAPVINTSWCLADEITHAFEQDQMKKDPSYAKNAAAMQQTIMNIVNNGTYAKQPALYTIPVVVHVVHNPSNSNNPTENVSDAVIFDMIATLNEDFQRLNPDTSQTRSVFLSDAADAQIEFCLASKDPLGASTTGITRTVTSEVYYDNSTETNKMKSAGSGGADPWDGYKYLNIWVCNISNYAGFGVAGYAYLPSLGMHGSAIDGLVLDFDIGIGFGSRTPTHEIGHYLGLGHTWGSNPPSCSKDDGFADTPNAGTEQYGCNYSTNTCGTTNGDQIENYMSYANCQNMFSNDQAANMQTVLTNTRASLLTSTGCEPTAAPVADFSVYDTLVIVGSTVQFSDMSTGIPDQWSWTFGGGGTPNTSTVKNPSIVYNTIGTYDAYLVATNSLGSDDTLKVAYIDVIALPPCGIPGAFYCEDFEGVTAPALPTGISTSTIGSDAGFTTGDNTDANSAGAWPVDPHTQFAMSNDDACNCTKTSDYLILPTFDFSLQGAMGIQFEGYDDGLYSQNPSTVEMNINSGGWNVIYTFSTRAAWQAIRLPLTGSAGASSVQLRFHYDDNGQWATGLAIDDIVIYDLPNNDLGTSTAIGATRDMDPWLTPMFFQIPVRQTGTINYNAEVSNLGALAQPNSKITVEVKKGNTTKFIGSSTPTSLAAGVVDTFVVTPSSSFNPTDTGFWSTTFIASSDSTDNYPPNDGVISFTNITDTVFARDNNIPAWQWNAASFGLTSPYEFANFYEFSTADTINSITVMLGPNTVLGTTIRGHIWDDALAVQLESTAFHVVAAADTFPNFLTLKLQSPLPVTALSNVFASFEEFAGDDTSMRIVTTSQNDPANVRGFIYGTGTWYTINYSPFIRINMMSTAKGCIDSLTVTSNDATCGGACDGDASVVVYGGNTPFTYLWDDASAQTNTTASTLCQGSYSVRVLDTYGCESVAGISVTDGAGMGLTVVYTNERCGNADGTATVTATGGSTPYTYTWTGGQTSSTATSLAAGTYHVTVEDAAGCSVETDFFSAASIGNIPPATANADVDASICENSTFTTNGIIGSSATSSTWSSSGTGSFNDATSLTAVYTPSPGDITAGSVILTLTTNDPDGGGPCIAVADPMTLTIDGEATANAGTDDATCEGDTYTMAGAIGGTASVSTWSTSGTGSFSSTTALNAIYTPSAADITAGTVSITITTNDPAGACGPVLDVMVLTINPAATASAGADATICEGSTHTLAGSRGGSATSSNWSTSGGGGFDNTGLLAATYTPNGADIAAGTVTLTLTTDDPDGVGPCLAATDIMVLTIDAAATATAGSDATICEGSTHTLAGAIGGSAISSTWGTSGTGSFNNASLLGAVYTPSPGDITAGSVTLTLTTDDPTGPCLADADVMTLTIDQVATAAAGANATICSDATHTVSGSRGGSAASSTWTTSGTGTFANSSLVTTVYTPSPADITAGTVNLTITTNDPAGPCVAATDVLTLTIDDAATAAAGADATICEGSTHLLGGSRGGGASSSTWTTSGTGAFDNAGIVAPTYTPSAADISSGSVTLTITTDNPAGPCNAATDNLVLTITLDPTVTAGAGVSICEGSTHTLAGAIGGGASSSTWTTAGTGTFDNASLLAATYTPSPTDISGGSVTLTLTTDDPAGPCTATADNLTITIDAAATAVAGSNSSQCGATALTLAGAIGGGATSSTWSTSGTGTFDNTTLLNATYTPSAADVIAGSVNLTLTTNDPTGPCAAAVDFLTLTLNTQDDPAFSYASGTFCQTGTNPLATITGTSGGVFSELSGDIVFISTSTGEINLSASTLGGPYTVQYVTGGACPDSSTVNVTITVSPDATFTFASTYCQSDVNPLPSFGGGASAGIFSATPGGMVFANTSTGEIDLALTAGGTYSVQNDIAAVGGCSSASANFSVTVDMMATAAAGADATICEGDLYTLSGSRGGSATSSTWTTTGTGTFDDITIVGATYTASAADVAGGNVTLTITTDNPSGSCLAVTDDMVLIFNPAASTVAGSNDTICAGDIKALSGAIGGIASTVTWTTSGTGTFDDATLLGATYTPSVADESAGSVVLTITTDDPTGPCNAGTDNLTLVINAIPTTSAGTAVTICEGSGHTLSGTMGGGASSITWTTAGTGTFDNSSLLAATYTPSALDVTVGTVTLIITTDDPAGSCIAATDNVLLTINSAATATAGADASICEGDTYTLAGTMGGSASTITWTSSGTGTFDDATILFATYTPSAADNAAGTVTLTITSDDPDGVGPCAAVTDDVIVTIDPDATVSAGTDVSICDGATHTLSGVFGGGASNITWTTSGTGTFDDATLIGATYTPSASDIAAGAVMLTIITDDPAGFCNAATDNMALTIAPNPTISLETVTDISCNGAGDGMIDLGATGGTVPYTFSIDTGITYQSSFSFTGLGAGTYGVMVSDSLGCTATGSMLNVVEPTAITVAATTVDANCGNPNGQVSATASGGTGTLQYLWDDLSSSTTTTVTGLPANTYNVVVTDANGCSMNASATIADLGGATASASLVKDADCNGDCNGEATVTVTGGTPPYVYSWNDPASQNTATATGLCAGTVIVTVTDSNSCQSVDNVTIGEPTAITVAVSPTDANSGSCDGLAVATALGGAGGYSYSWDTTPIQTNSTAINLCPGSATVTVTDGNGCTQTQSTTIGTKIGVGPEIVDLISLNIFPNPTQGSLNVEYSFAEAIDFELVVFNKLGAIVVSESIDFEKSGTYKLEFTDQANGIYYVQLITDQGTIIKKISLIK